MALFFDVDWFDARLADLGLNRSDLAASIGVDRVELHKLFTNERPASSGEMAALASALRVDLVEINLRCGVANRGAPIAGDSNARIADFEAKLDEIDTWLQQLEAARKSA